MSESSVQHEPARDAQGSAEAASAAPAGAEGHDGTRFAHHGSIPHVAAGGGKPAAPSASDRAFGPHVPGGPLENAMPGGLDLQAVRASMVIPGQRKLAGSYTEGGTLRTKYPSEVSVEVTRTGIRLSVAPGLYLDADWPLQDCELLGAGLDFATRQPYATVEDLHGLGSGMISVSGRISGKVTEMIRKAVAGTPLVAGHYDPMKDPNLSQTLDKVLAGFVELFGDHDEGHASHGANKAPPVAPEEMTRVSAGATFALRGGGQFTKDGSGLTVAANGPITITVDGAGNLRDTAASKSIAGAADAMNVQAVHLSSEALQVVVKGKPVAKIEAMTLERGGKITIDRMTPLGKLADAEAMESGLSLLAALVALHEGSSAAGGLYQNAQRPAVVDGVSRGVIEQQFTDTIHKLLIEYRTAVPGLDLARALGLG